MDCNRFLLMGVINRKFAVIAVYFAVLIALISCASAPVQEMSDARQAIQAAKEGGTISDSQANLSKAESLLKHTLLINLLNYIKKNKRKIYFS